VEADGEKDKAVFILEENRFNHGRNRFIFVIIIGLVAKKKPARRTGIQFGKRPDRVTNRSTKIEKKAARKSTKSEKFCTIGGRLVEHQAGAVFIKRTNPSPQAMRSPERKKQKVNKS
jgi:hypothetical protein